jgi:hypothetical protein
MIGTGFFDYCQCPFCECDRKLQSIREMKSGICKECWNGKHENPRPDLEEERLAA